MNNPHAFPTNDDLTDGMSLRDYFAAHAPNQPAEWFRGAFHYNVKAPKHPEGAAYCDGCKGDGDCEQTLACIAEKEHASQMADWRTAKETALYIRWRWAWADAMLAERNTQPKELL